MLDPGQSGGGSTEKLCHKASQPKGALDSHVFPLLCALTLRLKCRRVAEGDLCARGYDVGGAKGTMVRWLCAQVAEGLRGRAAGRAGPRGSAGSQPRLPAGSPQPAGSMQAGQDGAMAPPALQHMPQQPVEVVALGVPMPQHVREPTMGYPNNVLYPGRAVDMST